MADDRGALEIYLSEIREFPVLTKERGRISYWYEGWKLWGFPYICYM